MGDSLLCPPSERAELHADLSAIAAAARNLVPTVVHSRSRNRAAHRRAGGYRCLPGRVRLRELKESGQIQMGADVRQQGGELMGTLVELWRATAGALAEAGVDFDHVAKVHGARALQARCDGTVSQRVIDELVAAVLEILNNIIKLRSN